MHDYRKLATALLAATLAWSGMASAQAPKEIKVALSFPNGATWPYIAVAEEMGYFRQEGLKVDIVSLNGSAAAYKAIVTGQVDYGFCQPAQVLNGLAIGEQTKSFYTSYQGHVYQFATLADGPYKRIADLKGQKIGISTLAGGQYPYLLATLKNAGLAVGPGKDVEIAEVGRGGAAAVALQDKRVAAYSASFVDMMAIELKGIKLRRFMEGPTASFVSDSLTATTATLEKDPKTAIGLGRAIAKATQFCMDNADACWTSITKMVPENGKNPDFTKPLLKAVLELHALPAEAKGMWGYTPAKAWPAIHDYLLESQQLKQPVKFDDGYTNQFIPEINRFDAVKVKQDAASYKG